MLRQSQSQKMLQKLSPQQIQLMKLLQIPTATLDQRIKEELEANPALEEGEEDQEDPFAPRESAGGEKESNSEEEAVKEPEEPEVKEEDFELDEYLEEYLEDDPSSYKADSIFSGANGEEEKSIPIPVEKTYHDYLEQQLGMMNLTDERELLIAYQIVGSIDDDGYLRREPVAIIDDLVFAQNIIANEEEILTLLKKIQQFDPPGTGARDLQECLLLQIDAKLKIEHLDASELKSLQMARKIVADHFNEFTKKHYMKLQRQIGLSEYELKLAIDAILKMNPKPASGFTQTNFRNSVNYVIPDFIIENREGELDLSLNARNAPELRVNDYYKEMLGSYKRTHKGKRPSKQEKEAIMFIKNKIDSAKWFIDAIRQRQQTMLKTMYSIMQFQYDFFLTGDERRLRPMILKDIADITGLDISTVSRVANSKFVQTEFGTKRLKEFFSESLQTASGEEVSTFEVKKILTDIIQDENKRKPFSDEKLKNMLQGKGYNIARRTVAKYREQLNIPVARLRKEL